MTLRLTPPEPFDFEGTVHSHGWVQLAPLAWSKGRLERIHRLPSGRVTRLAIGPGVTIEVDPATDTVDPAAEVVDPAADPEPVREAVTRMLRLDEDLSAFHARCRQAGGAWAKVAEGRGRILRSPTVFEDVVKTLCTTNVAWSGTKRMVRALVETFGEPWPGDPDRKAFPTPEALAVDLDGVGLGYRAPYVAELAERVASGGLDLEALLEPGRATAEVKAALLDIRGVGPYAAASLLILLGHYEHLPVDSVFRRFVSERYFGGQAVGDAAAKAVYDDWGRHRALAYWFDLVEHG